MLNFRKPQLSDRDLIQKHYNEGTVDGTCYSFGSLIIWRDIYSVEIAEFDSLLLMRGMYGNERYYVYPSGRGDIVSAVIAMAEESERDGYPFMLSQLLPEHKKELEELFPGYFNFVFSRDDSEYVYSVKNMAELPGKSFHGKKGHINAFFKKHTDIHIDPVTEDNKNICMDIASGWLEDRADELGELQNEFSALQRAVNNFSELGFIGAILYADGKPVAFTLGEPLKNNTFCTHFEKTAPEYRDAYPVINNGFTKLMLSTYDFVNREEDTGSPGLRKAKMSYNPEFLLEKFYAFRKDEPLRKYRAVQSDIPQLKQLWKTVFDDDDDVIDYFFSHTFDCRDVFVYKKDDSVVSAFYLLDSDIVINNCRKKSKYLYAAATLPGYRRNGYMGEMIRCAVDYLRYIGYDFLFLCPAEKSLVSYYEKFGFVPAFKERFYSFDKSELSRYSHLRYFNCALSYQNMRASVPAASYVCFSDEFIDFASYCNKKYGIRKDAVFDDEAKVLAVGSMHDNVFCVDEAIAENGTYAHILSVISDVPADKYILKTPFEVILPESESYTETSGMLINLKNEIAPEPLYLGQPCM